MKKHPKKFRLEARSSPLEAATFSLKAKKSLGQHFLSSPAYLRAVADAAHIAKGDTVLEIGPGEGALTAELLGRGASVIAVEKDRRLIPILQEKFAAEVASRQLKLVEADALEFDPLASGLSPNAYKLVGNIPYYITGALLRKFLSEAAKPSLLVFLIQKEVAERIARSKKESILSLSIKAYGTPRYVKTVPRGAFRPAPKVDSAILAVESVSGGNFASPEEEARFFDLLHAGFGQKRKLLVRNLEAVLGADALERCRAAGIPEKARAEDVSLQKWLALAK